MKDYFQNQLIAAAAELLPPEWNDAAIALFRVGTGSDQSDWKIVLIAQTNDGAIKEILPKCSGITKSLQIQSAISNAMFELQSQDARMQQVVFRFSRDRSICDLNREAAELRDQEYIQNWKQTIFGESGGKQDAQKKV